MTHMIVTRITDDLIAEGHTPVMATAITAIMVREDITYEEKRTLLDHLLGRFGR